MPEATCVTRECAEPVFVKKRGLCRRCYYRAYRTGALEGVQGGRWRHRVTNADGTIGTCSECGPGVQIAIRHGRSICWLAERHSSRKLRHGLDQDAIAAMLAAIDDRCQVCRIEFSPSEPYCIDHDHTCCPGVASCGRCARGLLCRRCNAALGMMLDDPGIARAAAAYLDATKLPFTIPHPRSRKTPI